MSGWRLPDGARWDGPWQLCEVHTAVGAGVETSWEWTRLWFDADGWCHFRDVELPVSAIAAGRRNTEPVPQPRSESPGSPPSPPGA